MLGVLGGIGGFLLFAFVQCELEIGTGLCLASSRPYETAGIVVMVFGGILIVLGVLLLGGIFRAGSAPVPPTTSADTETHGPGRYCPECEARNLPEAAYCASCGTPLPAG